PNAKGKMAALSMTTVIQMIMLFVSAIILLFCNTKAKEVGNSQVFRAGVVALVSIYGVAWMADTYFANHMGILKDFLGNVVTRHPWTYAIVLFFTSKLVNSQGASVAIVVPMALSVGMDPVMVMSFIPACYGYFFLPTYPSDLACIGFDRSGTTRIGKFLLNHSFMMPGLVGIICACVMSFIIAHAIL
ncbi:MAG: anaerobic C4-dicarboxylate transporter family protein, partial [Dialister sp.]|nr:anaerobic C4-dicarboxylate transporter family protein [Dialister sp.]